MRRFEPLNQLILRQHCRLNIGRCIDWIYKYCIWTVFVSSSNSPTNIEAAVLSTECKWALLHIILWLMLRALKDRGTCSPPKTTFSPTHISWPGPIVDDGDDNNEGGHADKDDDDGEATSISYPMYPSELAGWAGLQGSAEDPGIPRRCNIDRGLFNLLYIHPTQNINMIHIFNLVFI